jgi:TRAP-type C4-dicarboxylate transport system permease small subunit
MGADQDDERDEASDGMPEAEAEAKPEPDPKPQPDVGAALANVALVPAATAHAPAAEAFPTRAWAAPLLRLDQKWSRFEVKLATVVLLGQIAALVLWVMLKGLASEYQPPAGGGVGAAFTTGNRSGLIVRALVASVGLGTLTYALLRGKVSERRRVLATSGVVLFGVLSARLWASAGATYFSNLLNWMQSASTLTLIGGLNRVATRLTLWLALLGGAIATSQGKHINVDVVMRFLGPRLRVIVAVIGWVAASIVCGAAVWGFVDDIAIGHFLAPADATPRAKLSHVAHEMGSDFFLLRRQITLDFKSLPHVLSGEPYNEYLHPKEWNEWMRGADWGARFAPDDVKLLDLPETDPRMTRLPIISIPGSAENVPGLLVRDFDFVVPFGLLILAIRFLMRSVLALAGQVRVDPDAAHGDDGIEAAQSELHPKTGAA